MENRLPPNRFRMLYRLCKLDGFPVIQIGGKKYILANDFNEWVMKNVGKVV